MIQNGCSSILCRNLTDEIFSLAKISNSPINQFSKTAVKKELATTWGKVPNYIKFSILNDVDNLKLEKQACVQHSFLKDCQKYMIMTKKGIKCITNNPHLF